MARIIVLAGTNGAGKSSIAGAMLRHRGAEYYNPDEATRRILAANPGMDEANANSLAWQEGVRQLETAIATPQDYAFETTLGGRTITALLLKAAKSGIPIHLWYAGLDSPERHLARIQARVAKGGHDIPKDKVRERYTTSRANLIQLMPYLSALRVFDNSEEADPTTGKPPTPRLVLAVDGDQVTHPRDAQAMSATPEWAKPIVALAISRVTAL
jgi:predicted ABC-type ATPase